MASDPTSRMAFSPLLKFVRVVLKRSKICAKSFIQEEFPTSSNLCNEAGSTSDLRSLKPILFSTH